MTADLTRDEPRRQPPHVDPDLPSGRRYGYHDHHAAARITIGPPEPRRRYRPRTYRKFPERAA